MVVWVSGLYVGAAIGRYGHEFVHHPVDGMPGALPAWVDVVVGCAFLLWGIAIARAKEPRP